MTRLRLRSIAHDIRLYSPPTTKSLPILDFSVARACAVFRAPASTHNSPLYVKLVPVFRALSIRNVVALFNLLLLERKIVVHSKSLSLVTRVCEALMAFLFPLQWDMVYVPVVPEALRGMRVEHEWVPVHQKYVSILNNKS